MATVLDFYVDGFSTQISFGDDPIIYLFEKEINPVGYDGNGFIDTTGMRNQFIRTSALKSLYTLTPVEVNAAYNTEALDGILNMLNVNQFITQTLPDATTIEFWGGIILFKPSPNKEGDQPMAAVTIHPTNVDDSGTEVEPVITPGSGSGF